MGTHPIFESDFDCLTDSYREKMEKKSKSKKEDTDIIWTPIGMFSKSAERRRASLATTTLTALPPAPVAPKARLDEVEEMIWTPFGLYPKSAALKSSRRASIDVCTISQANVESINERVTNISVRDS